MLGDVGVSSFDLRPDSGELILPARTVPGCRGGHPTKNEALSVLVFGFDDAFSKEVELQFALLKTAADLRVG